MIIEIPSSVEFIINKFYENDYESFMVGGCVRDSILGLNPKDFDITTSAKPEITESLFEKTIPTGIQHGTVTILIEKEPFEVTTYRTDGDYIDNRHPDSVVFVSDIKEDLSRRDFTINALAYNNVSGLIDYFNGISDIKNRVIKAVGDPDKRFQEDALRMIRAIRFSCQLDFEIESNTYEAIVRNFELVNNISIERIRDEFCKILISTNPRKGLELLKDTGILKLILPEINSLVGYTPRCNNHNKDVFEHTLRVLDNTINENNLVLRIAALFHDVGKLNTLKELENGHCYFPGHSEEGAVMSRDILTRLRFDNKTINKVCSIINDHLVLYVDIMPTDYEIKVLINRVGIENIFNLFSLQRADIKSLWNPVPFLKKVQYIEDKVISILENNEPLTSKDLDIKGSDILKELNLKPGPQIGDIISKLLDEVLNNPDINNRAKLLEIAKTL